MFLIWVIAASIFLISGINLLTAVYSWRKPRKFHDFYPTVSVLSRTWDDASADVVERKIKNFLDQDYPKSKYEIIIVHDSDKKGSPTERICRKYARSGKIKYHHIPRHFEKKAYALDDAIENAAKGDIIVHTDIDVVSHKDWLRKIVMPFSDSKIMAVSGIVMCGNWNRNWLTKIRAIEDFWYFCIAELGRYNLTGEGVMYGSNYAFRKSAWRSVGGHGKLTLTEDAEITAKFLEKGYKMHISADAAAVQEEVWGIKQYFNERRRWLIGDVQTLWKYKFYKRSDTVIGANFASDMVFIFSYLISPLNAIFLLPALIQLASVILGMTRFRVKKSLYFWTIPYMLLAPLLQFSVVISLAISRKVRWTPIWHKTKKLTYPINAH